MNIEKQLLNNEEVAKIIAIKIGCVACRHKSEGRLPLCEGWPTVESWRPDNPSLYCVAKNIYYSLEDSK